MGMIVLSLTMQANATLRSERRRKVPKGIHLLLSLDPRIEFVKRRDTQSTAKAGAEETRVLLVHPRARLKAAILRSRLTIRTGLRVLGAPTVRRVPERLNRVGAQSLPTAAAVTDTDGQAYTCGRRAGAAMLVARVTPP